MTTSRSEHKTQRSDAQSEVGPRLRAARLEKDLSLRELARRLDISASALSQIETGKSRPSVQTLYAIVTELGLSLDTLFAEGPKESPAGGETELGEDENGTDRKHQSGTQGIPESHSGPVQRAGDRASLELDSGVTWDRLTPAHDPDVDFLYVTYEVGGASSAGRELARHSGREYGVVLSGELEITVGFEKYSLGPGDSICFDSNEPHLLRNSGDEPAKVIWFVIGRRQSDSRNPRFDRNADA